MIIKTQKFALIIIKPFKIDQQILKHSSLKAILKKLRNSNLPKGPVIENPHKDSISIHRC